METPFEEKSITLDEAARESDVAWKLIVDKAEVFEQKKMWDLINVCNIAASKQKHPEIPVVAMMFVNRYKVKQFHKVKKDMGENLCVALAAVLLVTKVYGDTLNIRKSVDLILDADRNLIPPRYGRSELSAWKEKVIIGVVAMEMQLVIVNCKSFSSLYPWQCFERVLIASGDKAVDKLIKTIKSASWRLYYYVTHIPLEFFYDAETVAIGLIKIVIEVFGIKNIVLKKSEFSSDIKEIILCHIGKEKVLEKCQDVFKKGVS